MVGRDDEGRHAVESLGLSVRRAKEGSSSWRYESYFKDYGAAMQIVERIRSVLDVCVQRVARLGTDGGEVVEGKSAVHPCFCRAAGDGDVHGGGWLRRRRERGAGSVGPAGLRYRCRGDA